MKNKFLLPLLAVVFAGGWRFGDPTNRTDGVV